MAKFTVLLLFAVVVFGVVNTNADLLDEQDLSLVPAQTTNHKPAAKGTQPDEEHAVVDKSDPKKCPKEIRKPRWMCLKKDQKLVNFGKQQGVTCTYHTLCSTSCEWGDHSLTCLLHAADDPSYKRICVQKSETDTKSCLKFRWCRDWGSDPEKASCTNWVDEPGQDDEAKVVEAEKEKQNLAHELASTNAEIAGLEQQIAQEEAETHHQVAGHLTSAAQHIAEAQAHPEAHHVPDAKDAAAAPHLESNAVATQHTVALAKDEYHFNGGLTGVELCVGGEMQAGAFHCLHHLHIDPPAPMVLTHKYKEICVLKERKSSSDEWKCSHLVNELIPMSQEELARLLKLRRNMMNRHIKDTLEQYFANLEHHKDSKHQLKSEMEVQEMEIAKLKRMLAECQVKCGSMKTSVNAASAHVANAKAVSQSAAIKKASLLEKIAQLQMRL